MVKKKRKPNPATVIGGYGITPEGKRITVAGAVKRANIADFEAQDRLQQYGAPRTSMPEPTLADSESEEMFARAPVPSAIPETPETRRARETMDLGIDTSGIETPAYQPAGRPGISTERFGEPMDPDFIEPGQKVSPPPMERTTLRTKDKMRHARLYVPRKMQRRQVRYAFRQLNLEKDFPQLDVQDRQEVEELKKAVESGKVDPLDTERKLNEILAARGPLWQAQKEVVSAVTSVDVLAPQGKDQAIISVMQKVLANSVATNYLRRLTLEGKPTVAGQILALMDASGINLEQAVAHITAEAREKRTEKETKRVQAKQDRAEKARMAREKETRAAGRTKEAQDIAKRVREYKRRVGPAKDKFEYARTQHKKAEAKISTLKDKIKPLKAKGEHIQETDKHKLTTLESELGKLKADLPGLEKTMDDAENAYKAARETVEEIEEEQRKREEEMKALEADIIGEGIEFGDLAPPPQIDIPIEQMGEPMGTPITKEQAEAIFDEAGGDPRLAEQIARERGLSF